MKGAKHEKKKKEKKRKENCSLETDGAQSFVFRLQNVME